MKKPRPTIRKPTFALDGKPGTFGDVTQDEANAQWLTPWLKEIAEPFAAVILADQPVTRRMNRHLVVVRPWGTSYAARTMEEAFQFCHAAELDPIGIIDGALIRYVGRPRGTQPPDVEPARPEFDKSAE